MVGMVFVFLLSVKCSHVRWPGRSQHHTTAKENKRPGSNTGRGQDAGRQLRHGSGGLHGIHTRLGCCFDGQTTQICKVYECAAVLENLACGHTLGTRNRNVLLHPCYKTDSELCFAFFCRASGCFGATPDGSRLLAHGLVFGDRDARVATGAWPGGLASGAEWGVGWWRMVLVLLLANCELTSNLLSIRVVSSSSCHSASSDQAQGKIGQLSELTFEACI